MRPKKQKTPRSKPLIYSLLGVLLIVVLLSGLRLTHNWPFSRAAMVDPNATRQEKTATPTAKNNNPQDKQSLNSTSDTTKTTDQIPVSTSLAASITRLEESNNTIYFTGTVQGATTTGTCVVTFSNPNDRPVTQQVTATNSSSVSTCGPISIPANEFSYLGSWQVSFRYYEGSQQATAQSEITIQ